jgi:catechol 2,3-dioxygenase-like lactoylglutathione lyase family enzyme
MTHQPPLRLTHLSLPVRDLRRTERFYREQLGLETRLDKGVLFVDCPGFLLAFMEGKPIADRVLHFGFEQSRPEEVDGWIAALVGRGVRCIEAPTDHGALRSGRISDPDGYTLEFYHERGE